jgi:hypothetical protein
LTFVESNNDLEWLPDIDIFNPDNTFFVSLVAGDVLVYNGFDWTNAPLPSLDVAWSNLQSTLSNGQVIPYADAGISRLGAASLAIGNGTAGDFSGALSLGTITVGDFASLPAYLKTNPLVEGVLPSLNTVSGTIPSDSTNVGISTAVQSGGFGLGLTVYTLASGIGGGAYAIEAEAALASGTTGGNATALSGDLYIEDNTVTNCTAYGMSFGLWPAGGAGNYFYGSSVYIGSSGTATGVVEAICYQATNAYADPSSGTAIGLLIRSAISGATSYAIKSDTTAQSAFNGVIGWQNPGLTAIDTGISRLGAASLALGNGAASDFSGSLKLTGLSVQGSQTGPYSVSLTAQAATIAATNLVTTPVTTALYEITYYLNDTTAGTSGTVSLTITWNDGGSQTFTSSNVTFGTLGAYVSGTIVVKATSGAIQYATTVTSAVGSPAYSLDIRIKQLT